MASEIVLNNRYRLLNQLGAGGMAVVYRAEDLSLGRTVAVKLLRDSYVQDSDFLERFQHEARSAAQLAHPNIVTVHDYGNDDGRYYIVMEWVDGQDLKVLIRAKGRLMVERALDIAVQLCAGLAAAHRAGVAHCDVKPQNVIITTDGRAKITDFGIARALANIKPGDTTDLVWGSPQYFSPEQAAGEVPGPASDVYSMGIVMYEMLAGRLPFHGQNHQTLALMHMRETPPPLATYNPAVPETLERIVRTALAKEPAARYPNAQEFEQALRGYRERVLGATAGQPASAPGHASNVNLSSTPSPRPLPRTTLSPAPTPDDGLDWTAVALGFLAFVAVAGLIALWVFVFYLLGQQGLL